MPLCNFTILLIGIAVWTAYAGVFPISGVHGNITLLLAYHLR